MPRILTHHRRILLAALFLICMSIGPAAVAEDETGPRYRALLIACDEFVSAANMTPSGQNNLGIMQMILEQDKRGFEVKRQYGIIASKESLAYALSYAFADASEEDVSLVYISTHGEFDTAYNNPQGELLLSDGALEERITAFELNEMLDKIPGTKVVLVDACNSGALIGKGISPEAGSARVTRMFQSDAYKVLTSSGASEPSWYMLPMIAQAPPGASYFTSALAVGGSMIGGFAADVNRDGIITLKEMYDHLWINQASSVVQMYPQDDGFPFLVYDKAKLNEDLHGELTGFVFGSTSLHAQKPVLEFEYTATDSTRVAYRITYLQGGVWDWDNGVMLPDESEWDGDMDPMGDVTPGRKQVTLDLSDILPEDWTYAMLHVLTLADEAEGKQPFIYASRVLTARQGGHDPALSVKTMMLWNRKTRAELEIFVAHTVPANLTVSVLDAENHLIRRLSTSRTTRPQALVPDGSLFYWNGLDKKGDPVSPGTYFIEAEAKLGADEFTARAEVDIE